MALENLMTTLLAEAENAWTVAVEFVESFFEEDNLDETPDPDGDTTTYLLASEANKEILLDGIEQFEAGAGFEQDLDWS